MVVGVVSALNDKPQLNKEILNNATIASSLPRSHWVVGFSPQSAKVKTLPNIFYQYKDRIP